MWTHDRIETLKRMWDAGASAGQIALELGGVTRNGVIGKVHRLGLPGHRRAPASRPAASPRPRPPRIRSQIVADIVAGAPAIPLLYVPPQGQRRGLLELTELTCRWPFGEPGTIGFYFCGGAPIEGLPYCACHVRDAYQPVPARRRDRDEYIAHHRGRR